MSVNTIAAAVVVWWIVLMLNEIKLQTKYKRDLTWVEVSVCAFIALIPAVFAALASL
jgi:hypothetical protein